MSRLLTPIALLGWSLSGCGGSCEPSPPPDPDPTGTRVDGVPAPPPEIASTVPREGEQPAPRPDQPARPRPPTATVHDAETLASLDLAHLERLDLAFSETDRLGQPPDGRSVEARCAELDLLALAGRLPELTELRLSGCQSAAHTGLGAFGDRLRRLELADLVLDGVTVGRMSQLGGLQTVELTRVDATEDSLAPVASLPVRTLTLRELEKDSLLVDLASRWRRTLTHLRLEGSWAGHEAMLVVGKASQLEILELVDTRVGNFSLNQIKKLTRLREADFRGSTFNDNTPLYLRELPAERFACACPRVGDGGLRNLRFVEGLQELELTETRVSGAGLVHLDRLESLQRLSIAGSALSQEGLAAVAELSDLRALELRGPRRETETLPDLGRLGHLESLVLGFPDIGDGATASLAGLNRLRKLDLGGTAISDEGLAPIGQLTTLEHLVLHHTRVTNRGLAHLANLRRLQVLELDHCDVRDAGVGHLAGLPALRELRLDHTLVTDAVVDTLLSLPSLERLNLEDTVISDAGAARLGTHPKLHAVNLRGTRIADQRSGE